MNVWRKINELEWHKIKWKDVTDGKIKWKVVGEVEDDDFISIRDKENVLFRTKYCPVDDIASEFSKNNFAQSF